MDIPHVFAMATATVVVDGAPVTVQGGTHWPDDDLVVAAHPELFTTDCRYGLQCAAFHLGGEPPGYMSVPPGAEDPVMTAKVRARSQAERSRVPGGR